MPNGGKYALLFGVWAGITELIPYVGPWLGAAPPVLYALVQHPLSAFWVALLFLGIQQLEGHVVVPKVMGNSLRLHPLLVIFGLLAGGEIYGFPGILVALPLLAAARAVWEFFSERVELARWPPDGPLARRSALEVVADEAGARRSRSDAAARCARVGVARRFGDVEALAPTDFELVAGETVALVGPNGAGKSTLLAILAGALEPSEGRVETHARVGWVPQRPAHYARLSPRENLELFARLEGGEDPAAAAGAALERFSLPDDGRVGALSVGNRQRLDLAIALLGAPQLLLSTSLRSRSTRVRGAAVGRALGRQPPAAERRALAARRAARPAARRADRVARPGSAPPRLGGRRTRCAARAARSASRRRTSRRSSTPTACSCCEDGRHRRRLRRGGLRMSAVWLLLRKDLTVLRRSPLLLGALLAYPIVIALLVGLVAGYASSKPRVAFVDEDGVPPVVRSPATASTSRRSSTRSRSNVTLVRMGADEASARARVRARSSRRSPCRPASSARSRRRRAARASCCAPAAARLAPRVTQQVQALVYQLNRKLQGVFIKANLVYVQLILHGGNGSFLGQHVHGARPRRHGAAARGAAAVRSACRRSATSSATRALALAQTGDALQATAHPILLRSRRRRAAAGCSPRRCSRTGSRSR